MSAYDRFNVINGILPKEKQQSIIDSVFGIKSQQSQAPATVSPVPAATPTATETATQQAGNSFQNWLNQRKAALEAQRTDDVKMAKYNALGNLLTSMVQPIGWAAGGATAGVQPYDNRQYLEAFNRAIKANDELRNIGSTEAEYQFKLDEEARQRAIADEQMKKNTAANIAEYEAKRALDNEYGLNVSKKKANALQEAIDNWTHYASKDMSLLEYVDSLNATGYFGDDFKPDRETLARIEKQINERRKKASATAKTRDTAKL